jgi:glycosyltransferase involved in cell wall biosynthesis
MSQTYKNYEVVVVDDCSTDGTWETIQKYPFHKIRNKVRRYEAGENIIKGIRHLSLDKEDIFVILDGDDWFAGDFVLDHLNEVYQDKKVWLTYGQLTSLSKRFENFSRPIYHPELVRTRVAWCTSHPKTFKKKLFDRINDKDLRNNKGQYYAILDLALMYPMIEMAGLEHIRFIDKVLYVYNDLHPGYEFMSRVKDEGRQIRFSAKYPKVVEL